MENVLRTIAALAAFAAALIGIPVLVWNSTKIGIAEMWGLSFLFVLLLMVGACIAPRDDEPARY